MGALIHNSNYDRQGRTKPKQSKAWGRYSTVVEKFGVHWSYLREWLWEVPMSKQKRFVPIGNEINDHTKPSAPVSPQQAVIFFFNLNHCIGSIVLCSCTYEDICNWQPEIFVHGYPPKCKAWDSFRSKKVATSSVSKLRPILLQLVVWWVQQNMSLDRCLLPDAWLLTQIESYTLRLCQSQADVNQQEVVIDQRSCLLIFFSASKLLQLLAWRSEEPPIFWVLPIVKEVNFSLTFWTYDVWWCSHSFHTSPIVALCEQLPSLQAASWSRNSQCHKPPEEKWEVEHWCS